MKRPSRFNHALIAISLLASAANSHAAIDNAGILDNVLNRYSVVASSWGTVITAHASWLFWTLVLISMVWTFGMMAMRKADIGEFFAEFSRFTIFTGFFWWLLINGPNFANSIMLSLRRIGAAAAGGTAGLTPSGIVDIGFDIFFKVVDQSSVMAPVDSAIGLLMSLIILVVLALIGVNMLLLLISGWILAYAGAFFLGFGGSRWTSDLAIGYFKTVLGLAAQLLTMVLIVGIGQSFVDQYYVAMTAGISMKELSIMLIVAIILLALVVSVPPLIGTLAGGAGGGSSGGFGAGSIIGAAALGSAGIATAGSALIAGTVGMAGGAQALMAAFSKASAANAADSDGPASLLAAVGGGSNFSAPGTSSGGSDLASAMGGNTDSSKVAAASSGLGTAASKGLEDARSTESAPIADNIESGKSEAAAARAAASASGGSDSADDKSSDHSNGAGANSESSEEAAGTTSIEKTAKPRTLAAAGRVGKVAMRTAAILSRASLDVASGRAADLRSSFNGRVAETTGGKIAAAINDRHAGTEPMGNDDTVFGENSLSEAEPVESEQEIAAFRDRANPST
jgi:type IV secretion system protein TrbL